MIAEEFRQKLEAALQNRQFNFARELVEELNLELQQLNEEKLETIFLDPSFLKLSNLMVEAYAENDLKKVCAIVYPFDAKVLESFIRTDKSYRVIIDEALNWDYEVHSQTSESLIRMANEMSHDSSEEKVIKAEKLARILASSIDLSYIKDQSAFENFALEKIGEVADILNAERQKNSKDPDRLWKEIFVEIVDISDSERMKLMLGSLQNQQLEELLLGEYGAIALDEADLENGKILCDEVKKFSLEKQSEFFDKFEQYLIRKRIIDPEMCDSNELTEFSVFELIIAYGSKELLEQEIQKFGEDNLKILIVAREGQTIAEKKLLLQKFKYLKA